MPALPTAGCRQPNLGIESMTTSRNTFKMLKGCGLRPPACLLFKTQSYQYPACEHLLMGHGIALKSSSRLFASSIICRAATKESTTPAVTVTNVALGKVMSAEAQFFRVGIQSLLPPGADILPSSASLQPSLSPPTPTVAPPKQQLLCVARGLLRKMQQQVLVGDVVRVGTIDWGEGRGVVEAVMPRISELTDPAISNVDHVVLCFSLVNPPFEETMVTRFLVSMEAAGLPVTLLLNKCDLLPDEEVAARVEQCRRWGYVALPISCSTGAGLGAVEGVLRGKTAVVAGPSGAGKSSLINALRVGRHRRDVEETVDVNTSSERNTSSSTATTTSSTSSTSLGIDSGATLGGRTTSQIEARDVESGDRIAQLPDGRHGQEGERGRQTEAASSSHATTASRIPTSSSSSSSASVSISANCTSSSTSTSTNGVSNTYTHSATTTNNGTPPIHDSSYSSAATVHDSSYSSTATVHDSSHSSTSEPAHTRSAGVPAPSPSSPAATGFPGAPNPDFLAVGDLSRIGRGKHTTRNVTLLPLPSGALLADTPGFNQPTLERVTSRDLQWYFPEFRDRLEAEDGGCRYRDCWHLQEPGCCITSEGLERWPIYVKFLSEVQIREEYEQKVLQVAKKQREGVLKQRSAGGGKDRFEVRLEAKKHRRVSRRTKQQQLLDELEDDGAPL